MSAALRGPRLKYEDISNNVVYKTSNAINRKATISADGIQCVVRDWKICKELTSKLNIKRNLRSLNGDNIQRYIKEKNKEAHAAAIEEAKQLKAEITQLEIKVAELERGLLDLALQIPNDTHSQSPLGPESAAVTLSTHGPPPIPASPSRDHYAICQALQLVDFQSGTNVTGTSWYYLKNEAALLELALTNFSISMAVKHGFTPVLTPDVVRADIANRCGFQPRDPLSDPPKSQMYQVDAGPSAPDLVLSGTSEIPLGGMCANRIYAAGALPLKLAGASGVDTRGLYRVHQFSKVELFAVTEIDASEQMMEEMKNLQVAIYSALGFPFRVLDMPTEELGATAYRKYDMEAWMPGRGNWGEISSLSNCTDYQAQIRSRRQSHDNLYAHTLNGTAAAIPRLIVALLENGTKFDADNNIIVIELPNVLRPFWLDNGSGRNLISWV
ncbi:seryl-tRNA synthetase [Hymenopellis radicata]|nr:seryl-tRNA synthetase [Hymenopellis radicata]